MQNENYSNEADINNEVAKLLASGMSYEELAKYAAQGWSWSAFLEEAYEKQNQLMSAYESILALSDSLFEKHVSITDQLVANGDLHELVVATRRFCEGQLAGRDAQRKIVAKKGGDALSSRPGGSRENSQKMKDLWASGRYKDRNDCAEKGEAILGIPFHTGRKYLRNTPNPSPWPAKARK